MIRLAIFFCAFQTVFVKSAVVNHLEVFRELFSEENIEQNVVKQVGTDKGLYNEGFFEGDIYRKKSRMKNAVADSSLLWPHAAIIYRLDRRIGCPDSQQCSILMKAFDHYHKNSCIRFKEWSGESHYVRVFFNPDSGACWSAVGRTEGVQMLSLGQRCWYFGIVVHELGHTIGFWHEMNRPDRDEYISIHWKNILPGFATAFAKQDTRSVNLLGEDFDFTSIMMYDEYAFSKDGSSPTIRTKDNTVIGPIWNKQGLSASDIRRLHKLYDCEGNKSKSEFPSDVYCGFDSNPCGFKNGVNSSWAWRNVNRTDGYVYSSSKTSGNETGYFMSVNFHPLDVVEEESPLGCVKFWYLIKGDGDATLILRQSYLQKTTQLLFVLEDTFDLWESENATQEWDFVQLPIYVSRPFKLIFESEFQNSVDGLIALDDVEILYAPCEENEISTRGFEEFHKSRRKIKTDRTTEQVPRTTTVAFPQDTDGTTDSDRWEDNSITE